MRVEQGAEVPHGSLLLAARDKAVEVAKVLAVPIAPDGPSEPGAASVVGKRRRVLFNIAEYAVERKCIDTNPVPAVKWKAPKASGEIDRRSVVNPVQARVLLDAVRKTRRSGRAWSPSSR